ACTSSARMWRASGRGCTVMPCAPASRQARAARTTSGSLPPRELRRTAILLTLTLRTVIARSVPGDRAPPPGTSVARRFGGSTARRFVLGGRGEPARFGLLAQAAQLFRIQHQLLVARAAADAVGRELEDEGGEHGQRHQQRERQATGRRSGERHPQGSKGKHEEQPGHGATPKYAGGSLPRRVGPV